MSGVSVERENGRYTCLGCQGKRLRMGGTHVWSANAREDGWTHVWGVRGREGRWYTCLGYLPLTHVWGVSGREDGWTHVWGVRGREGRWYTCLGCQEKIGWVVHMSGVSGEDRVGGTHVRGVRRR